MLGFIIRMLRTVLVTLAVSAMVTSVWNHEAMAKGVSSAPAQSTPAKAVQARDGAVVKTKLVSMGVPAPAAQQKVAALSTKDLAALAQHPEQIKAGGFAIWIGTWIILAIALIIFIILEGQNEHKPEHVQP